MWCEIDRIIGRYLRGLALDALVIGALTTLGLWLVGAPYPWLLGAFTDPREPSALPRDHPERRRGRHRVDRQRAAVRPDRLDRRGLRRHPDPGRPRRGRDHDRRQRPHAPHAGPRVDPRRGAHARPPRHGGGRAPGDRGQGERAARSSSTAGTSRGRTCPRSDGPAASPSMSADLALPTRLLMGSGPTNPDPRVLRAMATGLVGQFDPAFTALMGETQELLRRVFRTRNRATFPVPGTSRAGMEAAVVSLVEPGERVARRRERPLRPPLRGDRPARGRRGRGGAGALGRAGRPGRVGARLGATPAAAVLVVHAETSTGVMNPVREVAAAAHRQGAAVVVDAVCSFAGAPLETDAWELDVVVAGTQKCLGCPSGLAPVTYSDAVAARMARRRSPIRSNYLDLTQLDRYWSSERLNHHTAPTTMVYGLREALGIVLEEGLDARIARHRAAGEAMVAGLGGAGPRALRPAPGARQDADAGARRACPDGIDDAGVPARASSTATASRSWARSAPSPAGSGGSARWRTTPAARRPADPGRPRGHPRRRGRVGLYPTPSRRRTSASTRPPRRRAA